MPFKSEKQRKWMHANEPKMAKSWEKKKKKEASLGSMMSKKVDKHKGTRNKAEIDKIYKLLVKYGNNKKDAVNMIKKNYDYVSKTYRKATPAKKAEILSSLQEEKKRDYKAEYKKFQSSTKSKKYRAE